MPFLNHAIAEFIGPDRIQFHEPVVYQYADGRTVTMPAGFMTDGASIPRILWSSVGSPFNGTYREPAFLHDYLYQTGYCRGRADADSTFLNAMKEHGVGFVKRWTIYTGVRAWGWVAWKSYREGDGGGDDGTPVWA